MMRACRWFVSEFQGLMLFEESGWAAWVPWDDVIVDSPVRMVYRRRHHRLARVTSTSKRCQELAHITFEQTLVSREILEHCMKVAREPTNYAM